ncbi:hypothetical protein ACJW30_12G085600 [Castanea mollissima]
MSSWDNLVEEALAKLETWKHLLPIRTIHLSNPNDQQQIPIENHETTQSSSLFQQGKASFQVQVAEVAFQRLIHFLPSTREEAFSSDKVNDNEEGAHLQQFKKLLFFAVQEHGMVPRGSALICSYTNYHRQLESSLASTEERGKRCITIMPLAVNAVCNQYGIVVTIGSIASLLAMGRKPSEEERIAIFSDAQNHTSIIDGIYLAERQQSVEVFVYRHCDILKCKMKKKVVVTDGLFSMDGDFAPMVEIVKLRKKHQFLLVVDDAHGTFVCGKNGGGVAEEFNCEEEVDICIGTLSKTTGCYGGFIACSKSWKLIIQSRGRSFIFSTAMLVPDVVAAHAAVTVAKKETWRRREIWKRVQDFRVLTGIPISSPIISLIVGSEEKALLASRHLLTSGFYIIPIGPPAVPPNSCRLRVTLSAVHTMDDLKKLTTTLSQCINFKDVDIQISNKNAKL